eukprot:sb/3466992/
MIGDLPDTLIAIIAVMALIILSKFIWEVCGPCLRVVPCTRRGSTVSMSSLVQRDTSTAGEDVKSVKGGTTERTSILRKEGPEKRGTAPQHPTKQPNQHGTTVRQPDPVQHGTTVPVPLPDQHRTIVPVTDQPRNTVTVPDQPSSIVPVPDQPRTTVPATTANQHPSYILVYPEATPTEQRYFMDLETGPTADPNFVEGGGNITNILNINHHHGFNCNASSPYPHTNPPSNSPFPHTTPPSNSPFPHTTPPSNPYFTEAPGPVLYQNIHEEYLICLAPPTPSEYTVNKSNGVWRRHTVFYQNPGSLSARFHLLSR